MLDLEVYDLVKINNAKSESIYLESVNSIDNKKHIATTDHFRIKLDNGEVINDLGMYDDDKFELRMTWRLNSETKDYMLWDVGGEKIQHFKEDKRCNEDVRHNDVSWEEHRKTLVENAELKDIIVELNKEINTMKKGYTK